jgi:hypothetical protein
MSITSYIGREMLPIIGSKVIGPGILKIAVAAEKVFEKTRSLNVGSSTILREQLEKVYGLAIGALTKMGVQVHHIIPKTFRNDKLLNKIKFNIDSAINAIPIKEAFHFGSHKHYNDAFQKVLNDIWNKVYLKTKDVEKCREYVLDAIKNANNKILEGSSLRKSLDDISVDDWYNAIIPKIE